MTALAGSAWRQGKHWGMWFRIFGYGLVLSTMQPIFSERNGYAKAVRVFGIKIAILKP